VKTLLAFVRRAGPIQAQITYTSRVALEWIAFVLIALVAIAVMLLACLLYPIICAFNGCSRGRRPALSQSATATPGGRSLILTAEARILGMISETRRHGKCLE
jgi:hypothetical protein